MRERLILTDAHGLERLDLWIIMSLLWVFSIHSSIIRKTILELVMFWNRITGCEIIHIEHHVSSILLCPKKPKFLDNTKSQTNTHIDLYCSKSLHLTSSTFVPIVRCRECQNCDTKTGLDNIELQMFYRIFDWLLWMNTIHRYYWVCWKW